MKSNIAMSSCEYCPFHDIDATIEKYQNDMKTYLRETNTLIDNWELYEEFQKNINLINISLPKTTAVHSFNTIQLSLSSMTWLSLMKLWDDKIKGKNNVRLARIYTFIKDGRFKNFITEKYYEFPDIIKIHLNKRKKFLSLYDEYTNGNSKNIYDELKKIRHEILAHAQIDSVLFHLHSKDDLNKFYIDTIQMIESAYYLFNVGISLGEWQERVRRNARSLVAVMTKSESSSLS